MAKVFPVLPVIAGGDTVPAGLCRRCGRCGQLPHAPRAAGRAYELGGPKIYSFRELIELLLAEIRRKRLLLDLPFGLAAFQARLMAILPNPPLTPDQVELLKRDNVVSPVR